jgi:glyoxalase family protein
MANTGQVHGTHHLTFCVGGAQEDYDFHVRTLGLHSVKKTVLFDGEIPIYHLYYANRVGDGSTILTSFPYRQAGWMGRRGTNQLKSINVAVPADALGFWRDRLRERGFEVAETERFGTPRLEFAHPCGIPYQLVGDTEGDDREPWDGGDVDGDHAIRGAYGTTTSVREVQPMDEFLTRAFGARHVSSEGKHHRYEVGEAGDGHGRSIELVEEPDLPQGSWTFGEGTIHHHAFDLRSAENQATVKDWIVGLGYTDVSDVKDRGYFHSVYLRTPGGALFELAVSTEQGFLIDEAEDELGTHLCIPPHWEHRRPEIEQLEAIDTDEPVAS